ncbi:MAG: phasin family protein [Xanthobacteraceae bacterium]|nr:phasin family protein [Xanthobacteraceae bacterium]
MVKVEGFPQYGKEQFEAAVASANNVQQGFKAIATAWGDYAKRSFQDGNAYLEKLAGSKSWDKAMELQGEFAKSSLETFVQESQKISGLYADLAKEAYKPFEEFASKLTPKSMG